MSNPLCLLPKLIDRETDFYSYYLRKFKSKERVEYLTRSFDWMSVHLKAADCCINHDSRQRASKIV